MIFALKQGHLNAAMLAGMHEGAYDPSQHVDADAVFDSPTEMLDGL